MRAVVDGIEWNLCGRAQVQCDVCRDVYNTGLWRFLRRPERDRLLAELKAAGWMVSDSHDWHICPDCVEWLAGVQQTEVRS